MNETVGKIFTIFENFTYDGVTLNIIKIVDDIWFRAKEIRTVLGYKNTRQPIFAHVDEKDKITWVFLIKNVSFSRSPESGLIKFGKRNNEQQTIYINESGAYSLIFTSKLPDAKVLKKWVTNEVLPSIRKTGKYVNQDLIDRIQQLKLENQTLTTENQTQRETIQEKDTVIHEKAAENKEQHDTISNNDVTINTKSEAVVPHTVNPKLEQHLLLVLISDDYQYSSDNLKYFKQADYICIRIQQRSLIQALRHVRSAGDDSNHDAKIIYKIINPNPINCMIRLKEGYKTSLTCDQNGITTHIGDEKFIKIISKVNAEKYPYGVKF